MKKKGDFHHHRLCEYCLKLIPLELLRNIGNGKYICEAHEVIIYYAKRKGGKG